MSSFSPVLRTDLASEAVKIKPVRLDEHVSRADVTLDEASAKELGKAAGRYTTLFSRAVARGEREYYGRLIKALAAALREFVHGARRPMVVGLGNPAMTADALGSEVVKRVRVTRGMADGSEDGVCVLSPNVMGVTGIESFDIVRGTAERVKPDLVIVADSLCAAASERIASAFQITDAGITPGSGVSNFRRRFDRATLGTEVVSVGVPLVVYASTLIREAGGEWGSDGELVVTPKDIDLIVGDCALVIASAINKAL